ncbi:hypothetical protein Pelo_8764 [Pelomyxa schiedti]|nr:hypothetical protein Pelo_8764 [Pelomyxa schiedti]
MVDLLQAALKGRSKDKLKRMLQHSRSHKSYSPQSLFLTYEEYRRGTGELAVGDVIKWKPHMKNRQKPKYSEFAVVISLNRGNPYYATSSDIDAVSPIFNEPLDLAIGLLEGSDFMVFYYDSNRFMKATDEEAASPPALLLKGILQNFLQPADEFVPGDLVCWKPHLKNKKLPEECGIVVEVLEVAVTDPRKSAGTPYFHEPLDIKIGVIDKDGDFMIFHYDKRRFQKRPPQVQEINDLEQDKTPIIPDSVD